MKVSIITIATGKYTTFIPTLVEACEKFFLPKTNRKYIIFSDSDLNNINEKIKTIHQEKLGWPYDTMERFSMFQKAKTDILDCDYVYFLNANMLPVKEIGNEILPPQGKNLVGMIHPSFLNTDENLLPYERRDVSSACIPFGEGEFYFQGCFNGGRSEHFMEMCGYLIKLLEIDYANETYPIWHDESLLNKYYNKREDIHILNPCYGYPENVPGQYDPYSKLLKMFDVKMIQRNKTLYGGHKYMRS